jgi:voltage-gated potassium channel
MSESGLATGPSNPADGASGLIARLRELYEGDTPEAHRFRYGLLIFDIISVLFIIITSFVPQTSGVELLDVLFGLVILADFAARLERFQLTSARSQLRRSSWRTRRA